LTDGWTEGRGLKKGFGRSKWLAHMKVLHKRRKSANRSRSHQATSDHLCKSLILFEILKKAVQIQWHFFILGYAVAHRQQSSSQSYPQICPALAR
jgi:hypothetical protein